MTLIDRTLDLDLRPARPTVSSIIVKAVKPFAAMLRVLRNREQISRLEDFTDSQLADIGLTRADVRSSLSGGTLSDPSDYLTRQALKLRSTSRGLL